LSKVSITVSGICEAVDNLKYRPGSVKYKAIKAIQSFYTSEKMINELYRIDTDTLIDMVWQVGTDPKKLKSKRRNFYSIKSAINTDLEKLSKKGKNPDNIIIAETNIFDMTEEAKTSLLQSFSDAVKTGDVDIEKATGILKAVTEFLETLDLPESENKSNDIISEIKKVLSKMGGRLFEEGEGEAAEENEIGGDEQIQEIEVNEDEEIEEIEIDEDEEIELDEDIDEIEAVDDEEVEEIELDEDEEIEEVDDEDLEEIELDEDEEIEEVEDIDDDAEEIELEADEDLEEIEAVDDEDIEELDEIELDEDEEIEEVDDGDLEEIELDEDEEIEEVEDIDDDVEEIELEADEDLEEIEAVDDEDIEELDEIELDEDEEIEEIDDEGLEDIELDEDEEIEEIDLGDDETLEELDELDEDEQKALEEFRKSKEMANHFDETLGDREKKFNAYIKVPAGTYTVGTQKALKASLELQQFEMPLIYLAKYPVINSLFEIFIEQTGYVTTAEKKGFGTVYHARYSKKGNKTTWRKEAGLKEIKGACWYHPNGPGSSLHGKRNHPVVQISVEDAIVYASWIGRRLPSEAEWEAAARTDLGLPFPWGNTFNPAALNIESSGYSDTTPVDEYDDFSNEFGVTDMLGNVMEWTQDSQYPPFKTRKKTKYNIAKGGAWNATDKLTISSRGLYRQDFTSNTIGFRCISELFQ